MWKMFEAGLEALNPGTHLAAGVADMFRQKLARLITYAPAAVAARAFGIRAARLDDRDRFGARHRAWPIGGNLWGSS